MNKILQNEAEFAFFLTILQREHVRSYLEIGSRFGTSLVKVAERLPVPSTIVAVDLPLNKDAEQALRQNVFRIRALGHNAHLFIGDSTDPAVINQVRAISPFDCVFIDANHTLKYVALDWSHYGPLARIVCFHDISWVPRPGKSHLPIEVPGFWNSIKDDYRWEEIKFEKQDNGIGVLWRC